MHTYYKTSLWLLDWSVLISDFLGGLAPLIGAHCDRPTSQKKCSLVYGLSQMRLSHHGGLAQQTSQSSTTEGSSAKFTTLICMRGVCFLWTKYKAIGFYCTLQHHKNILKYLSSVHLDIIYTQCLDHCMPACLRGFCILSCTWYASKRLPV